MSAYATRAISKYYSGHISRLKAAAYSLDGKDPVFDYPYDLAVVFSALPRVLILFLFNDADEQFPAQNSILYERRAASFLDAECRAMIDWYLFEHLKEAEKGFKWRQDMRKCTGNNTQEGRHHMDLMKTLNKWEVRDIFFEKLDDA